eukprot:3593260-Lingulodinium_polyedra.AAC.1
MAAAFRRMLACVSGHVFDDVGKVSIEAEGRKAEGSAGFVFGVAGVPVNPIKHEQRGEEVARVAVIQ